MMTKRRTNVRRKNDDDDAIVGRGVVGGKVGCYRRWLVSQYFETRTGVYSQTVR